MRDRSSTARCSSCRLVSTHRFLPSSSGSRTTRRRTTSARPPPRCSSPSPSTSPSPSQRLLTPYQLLRLCRDVRLPLDARTGLRPGSHDHPRHSVRRMVLRGGERALLHVREQAEEGRQAGSVPGVWRRQRPYVLVCHLASSEQKVLHSFVGNMGIVTCCIQIETRQTAYRDRAAMKMRRNFKKF